MKALNINHLKFIKGLFLACCIAVVAFGCEKEMVQPEAQGNTLQGGSFPFLQRPPVQCGPSMVHSMMDGATDLGSVEILNNSSDLYLIFNMNQFKFIEEVKVFNGDAAYLPMDGDGNIQMEQFGFQQSLTSPMNDYTLTFPLSGMPTCTDLVIWARVSTRNMWGQVTATNYAWMTGTPISNGFKVNFCITSCISSNNSSGSTI